MIRATKNSRTIAKADAFDHSNWFRTRSVITMGNVTTKLPPMITGVK